MSRKPFFPVSLNLEGRSCVVIGTADDPEAIAKAARAGGVGRERAADLRGRRPAR